MSATISTTTFRIARRGTSREINRLIALNLVRAKQHIVPLGEHPRLRGAVALVSTQAFAAPIVA